MSRAHRSVAPLSAEEVRQKEDLRRRSLQVSTFCLHAMAWVLVAFYAADYLPPLLIRATVGLHQPSSLQYLVGYLVLGTICLVLGVAFGVVYGQHMERSRYRWRWYVFPVALAVLLLPVGGFSELLTRGLEAVVLLLAIFLGEALSQPWRRWRRHRSRRGPWAAP